MVGKPAVEVFPRAWRTAALEAHPVNRLLQGQTFLREAYEFEREGQRIVLECSGARVESAAGAVTLVLVMRDVTERKRTEETVNRYAAELQRSNRELERFAYD